MKITVTHRKGSINFEVSVCPRNENDYGLGRYVSVFNDNTDYCLDGRYWGQMDTAKQIEKFVIEWAKSNWGENFVKIEFDHTPPLVPMPGIERLAELK